MTPAGLHRSAFSIGWLASLSLHAALAFGVVAVAQRVVFVPQIPFTWQVAMVASSSHRADPSAAQSGDPQTSQQLLRSSAPPPSHSSKSRPMPHAIRHSSPTAAESPIIPTPAPVGPKEEPIVETPSQAETALASRPNDRHTERPSDPDSIALPSPAQPIPLQPEGLSPAPTTSVPLKVASATRPDYRWLSETILRRMEELKKYPIEARLNQAQGKVVLRAVIRGDGSVEGVEVAQSSGHQTLDQAALELLKVAGPFQLPRPLETLQLIVKIPLTYRLQ